MTYNPNWSTGEEADSASLRGSIDIYTAITAIPIPNPFTKSRIESVRLFNASRDLSSSVATLTLGTTSGDDDLATSTAVTPLTTSEKILAMTLLADEVRTEATLYLNVEAVDTDSDATVDYQITFSRLDLAL